jgi:serine/threonine protein phosphatase PrpC
VFQIAHKVLDGNSPGQDRAFSLSLDSRVVLAVADGAGGRSGGVEAAEMAIQHIKQRASTLDSQKDCENLLIQLDQLIATDKIAGETTAVVCVVKASGIVGASSGDSGAWVIEQSAIDDLTSNQVRKPFLGSGASPIVGFARNRFAGTLLVATDGLLKYTSRELIAAAVRNPVFDSITGKLISLVRYQSGALPDDVSIVLCR